jgi:hypothetical protein
VPGKRHRALLLANLLHLHRIGAKGLKVDGGLLVPVGVHTGGGGGLIDVDPVVGPAAFLVRVVGVRLPTTAPGLGVGLGAFFVVVVLFGGGWVCVCVCL